MLFFLGTAFFAFTKVGAAPTRYDQRQDGDFNVHAHLENFLFVGLLPLNDIKINYSDLGEFAWQALGIQEAVSRAKEQGLIKSGEAIRQEDSPFSVEIVQINENRPDKESSVRKAEEGDTSNVSDQRPTPVSEGQTKKIERIARNVKNFDFPKSREVPAVPGYFMNVRKTSRPKTRDDNRARNVVGNVWNPDDEPGRPGTSLKKQLPRRGEGHVALPSSNADKNDVSSSTEKQKEPWLLGDSIENCGPGRHRDVITLICQNDEPADSV